MKPTDILQWKGVALADRIPFDDLVVRVSHHAFADLLSESVWPDVRTINGEKTLTVFGVRVTASSDVPGDQIVFAGPDRTETARPLARIVELAD